MSKNSKLARARAKLERKLAAGWQRAVFASPQREDGGRDEQVLDGPGVLEGGEDPRFAAAFATLWQAAQQAADRGLVKLTVVIDARHRVEIDARHGHVKARVLDDETVDKIMGGKDRSLRPDRSAELLRAIGIMNADGSISARSAKKYKQVNHLVALCRPVWEALAPTAGGTLRILDLACGNSYLSFVLLEALRLEGIPARLLGVDRREDVIAQSRARAGEIGFAEQARFVAAALETLHQPAIVDGLGGPPDLAISLHACDTASDAALDLAIALGARAILCVPCCQAELARQLGAGGQAREGLASLPPTLLEHGLLRRGLGELLTDALRVELLEAWGYDVAVLEFVDSAHTPKNLLLRALPAARPRDDDARTAAIEAVARRCRALGVAPTLLERLQRRVSAAPVDRGSDRGSAEDLPPLDRQR